MGLIEIFGLDKKNVKNTISMFLIIIGFLAFPFFLLVYMFSFYYGLFMDSISILYVILALFLTFIPIALVLSAIDIKKRFIIASGMALFLFIILLLMSYAFIGSARLELENYQEYQEFNEEFGISEVELVDSENNVLSVEYEPRFSEDTLILYEQLNLSGILISILLIIGSLLFYLNIYLKTKKQLKTLTKADES
jgi:hypothetical protein